MHITYRNVLHVASASNYILCLVTLLSHHFFLYCQSESAAGLAALCTLCLFCFPTSHINCFPLRCRAFKGPRSHQASSVHRVFLITPIRETTPTNNSIMVWGFVTCGPNEALVVSGNILVRGWCKISRAHLSHEHTDTMTPIYRFF